MTDPATPLPCPACGRAAPLEARFCSHCGQALGGPSTPAPLPRPRWYYNVWFVLVMLFFVIGPFGLPLVWKNPHFSRRVKVVLTLIMAVYTVLLVDLTIRMVRFTVSSLERLEAILE